MTTSKESIASCDTLLCRCQGRIADGAIEAIDLSGVALVDGLCRGTAGAALSGGKGTLSVGCSRESPILSSQAPQERALRFFPAREYGAGSAAAPRLAALIAMARLPEPAPVESVPYESHGRLAILGAGPEAMTWARRLQGKADGQIQVTVFAEDEAPMPAASPREIPLHRARAVSIDGWLGAFDISWTPANPVDASRCTGCGACLEACSSDAIVRDGVAAYVDLARCNDKQRCIEVCEVGAIDFSMRPRSARFDLVLDLAAQPRLAMAHPPQGYFAPRGDPFALADAALALTDLVGEFDKPRFFEYKRSVCAHSRSRKEGCSRCIDSCSTSAISADGDGIRVEPHLCMGCGACASVCPSGAMRYNYPDVPYEGERLRAALSAWQLTADSAPTVLFHGRKEAALLKAHAETEVLPAELLPIPLHDAASVGPDLLLYALCAGAARVMVWQDEDAPATYRASASRAASFAQAVLEGLDLAAGSRRFVAVCGDADELMQALAGRPAPALGRRASFHPQTDKRGTLDLCFRHLATLAPEAAAAAPIVVPEGSAYGTVNVAADKCTLCLSCVSACPARALSDDKEHPRLRFLESACVQCDLCVETCPEDALSLEARLDLRAEAKKTRTLHEDTPCNCARCGKAFASTATVRTMVARLSGHALFATESQRKRLLMCGDCRVIDMMEHGEMPGAQAAEVRQ
ncbi:MAG: 4Fe-4S binding protein [Ottowia sp.]|nr:4Fe-4S binding protein [Ottowia sp.]